MNIIKYPDKTLWSAIVERPHIDRTKLITTVSNILAEVRNDGDKALFKYGEIFDKVKLQSVAVTPEEMEEADCLISKELKDAMRIAYNNIFTFHESQRFQGEKIVTQPGVTCWQKQVPIERVGLYVPGGSAPLFSTVLMLAVPAKIANCNKIVLCTPPGKNGKIAPAVLSAAKMVGVDCVFKVGGVQAIGAMAYGTESIPCVYKIFGPGNQYVTEAKQQVCQTGVAIDMPAGPSEVCIIADKDANAAFVASDLLSQAEHGPDSQCLLITTSEHLLEEVQNNIAKQLETLPRKEIASKALHTSKLIVVKNDDDAMELSNLYAPEHLIIQTRNYEVLADKVINAGSVFLGNFSCESAGDYASGTNHTLPTNGYAKAYSGVNLDSYFRKITFQHLDENGIKNIGHAVELMADTESLIAHKRAMSLRLESIK